MPTCAQEREAIVAARDDAVNKVLRYYPADDGMCAFLTSSGCRRTECDNPLRLLQMTTFRTS